MKTVLIFAGLLAVALAVAVPQQNVETKSVDGAFVAKQKKVFDLLSHVTQLFTDAEYYTIGKEYDIESNFDNYTNKKAIEEFMLYFKNGMLPKSYIFSVFYERMREEAVALYHLFYYAKDFETFYKTAAWARYHLNEGMFVYSFSIAVLHREDTKGLVLPAPYEIYPYFFVNADVISDMYLVKTREGKIDQYVAEYYGITKEDNAFIINANYSGWKTFDNEEQKLSYFTEDIGLNTYYYYFHATLPFWMTGNEYGSIKERRGEYYFYFHQQLLARYYMERLTNGLGEIPQFSWRFPIKTGYTPHMMYQGFYPFIQRNNYYQIPTEQIENVLFLEAYEKQFIEFLEQGYFHSYKTEVDLKDPKAVNFVGNYWQSNFDLYDKSGSRNYEQYYDIIARILLGATPKPSDKHFTAPVALEQFQTSLRDPAFFQLYKRIMYYFLQYKQYLEPYTKETLNFDGVKITDVSVDQLVTYFENYDFDATNGVYYSNEEFKNIPYFFTIRQPRLNQRSFNVKIEYKSEVNADAMVKIFFAPKYDSKGFPISLEDNWMNFVELDWFQTKLVQGKNEIIRNSEDFFFYKDDSMPTYEVKKMLDTGKVPLDMSEFYFESPKRLMLPRGTEGGYPFQFFVMVYPYVPLAQEMAEFKSFFLDNKPLGYPFDRPVNELYFYQNNMFFKDVQIYHDGEDFTYYRYSLPGQIHQNAVPWAHIKKFGDKQ